MLTPRIRLSQALFYDHIKLEEEPEAYKILQGLLNVQDGLDSGRDDGDGSSTEFGQVGADVERRFGSSVDAADAAGHKNRNSGLISKFGF